MNSKYLKLSKDFNDAILNADEKRMREIAHPECMFVHIGMNAALEEEIKCYTSGTFKPEKLIINSQNIREYGDTAVILTDLNYGLKLNGEYTEHHFMVTEVYCDNKLVQYSYSALLY